MVDVLLALGSFGLFTLPLLVGLASGHGPEAAIAWLGLLAALPLAVRRRAPVPVLVLVSAALTIAALSDVRFTPWVSNTGPALAIAAFTVAERLPRRPALRIVAIAIAVVTSAEIAAFVLHPETDQDAVQLFIGVAGLLLGGALRARREHERQLQAERRERAAETERRIRAEERLRVMADVHDIVSHALTLITVRSGVARMVVDQRPDEAQQALMAIETASRGALEGLRTVLRRRDDDRDRPGPAPVLADVRSLVDALRVEGYPLTLHLADDVRAAPLVEESAYRVVQEALTNVMKHAGQVPATTEITCTRTELVVSVINAPGPRAPGVEQPGFGLTGMRERVGLHGGRLQAGPHPDGGFAVRAVLPTTNDD